MIIKIKENLTRFARDSSVEALEASQESFSEFTASLPIFLDKERRELVKKPLLKK